MRILQVNRIKEIKQIMQDIRVDPYGIRIMLPKAVHYLVKMDSVSNITANILKQEMLSLGGDAAVARGALTGKVKKTGCLLMGNLSQLNRLNQKLRIQPLGLNQLSQNLNLTLKNYLKDNFYIDLGKYKLNLAAGRTCIMGILNVTPDSFSGDGLYQSPAIGRQLSAGEMAEVAQKLVEDGADIIDVGGESSRPGARPVSAKEEISRTIPLIRSLSKKIKVPISIDTYKPEVAQQALESGAVIVNDITALRNHKMARLVAKYKAAVVIMHMKGNPRTMQKNPKYVSLIDDIIEYLEQAMKRGIDAGIQKEKFIIDPGIGFGKTVEDNLTILQKLQDFKVLGRPILVGTSRKSFIGKILNANPMERLPGTISSSLMAVKNGAKILRVHDVKKVKQALKVFAAIDKI
jgi:dihydropteroate synthase